MLLSRAFLALTWVVTAAQAALTTGDGKTDPGVQIIADCFNASLRARYNTRLDDKRFYRHSPPSSAVPSFTEETVAAFPVSLDDGWEFGRAPCFEIRKLYYSFALLHWYGGGTWDTLELVIGNSTGIKIADAPAVGRYKAEVSLSESFGQETIDIRSLGKLQIMTKNATNSGAGDDWAMKGIVLSGVCADSSVQMWMSKYVDVGSWFSHVESGPAWSGAFDFLDWSRKGPNPAWGL
ncbi:hypothetical protein IF1G_07351 [Cordyceps javanica]|uniref:Uncharacterized protein n=1 Tax=Cordyceps javanica TaxID=43265 RepID=A0A545VKV9_9HYPO|nr:hypothetical protein IF1G_07351 [Cordyceps javanica]TQW02359.1 hypothetical protein IF2G_10162 [Cordyceps javanica]